MASSSQLRLMSDLKSIVNEPPEGCSASPLSDENLYVWSATIFGPDETPWEGGVFGLRLIFGDHYPEKPPRVRFTSEIFHPNDKNNSFRSSMDNNVGILINNIANLVPVKLTRDNYFLWKSLFLPILRSHDVLGFVDGTNVCPPKFLVGKDGKVTDSVNPLYKVWDQKDQALLACLNATISESLLPYVVGLPTSRDLWVILEQRYLKISLAHKIRLRSHLRTIKKGNSSMGEYLDSIKQISDKLAAAGCPLDDADIVFHIFNGLPKEYEALHMSILYRPKPISVDELYDLLSNIEPSSDVRTRVQLHSDGNTPGLAAANSSNAQGQDKNSFNDKGRGKDNYKGGYSNTNYCSNTNQPSYYNGKNVSPHLFPKPPSTCNSNLLTCQICNEVGHTADYCHNRMNRAYQGRTPSQELAAMEAQNTTQGNYWYADTGAAHHVTSSLSNFSIHSD